MPTKTTAELAAEAYAWLETATRDDGTEYTHQKDGAPEWLKELVYAAHGDFGPDDWRYDAIHSALGAIDDAGVDADLDELEHEWADGHVDVYTAARFAWLASNLNRQSYCDEAREEFGLDGSDIAEQIGSGQYFEAREVFQSVRSSLEELAGDDD